MLGVNLEAGLAAAEQMGVCVAAEVWEVLVFAAAKLVVAAEAVVG